MEGPGTGCETEGKTACDERKERTGNRTCTAGRQHGRRGAGGCTGNEHDHVKQNAEKGNKNMNMTGRRYIAYGSNLNRAQMALRCPDAKVVGTGEIKDYELLFRGNRNGAVATVEPKKGRVYRC